VTNPSEPFTRASIYLGPLLEGWGFVPTAREYEDASEGRAVAEYLRGGVALRLVWEGGEDRALWLETARSTGGSIISRWTDIEWIVAGRRLELDRATDDARLQRLASALAEFLDPSRGFLRAR
jgi:hypothetical protein